MNVKRLLGAVRRLWWLVAAAVAIGLLAGLVVYQFQTKMYTSTARLFVSATGGATSTEAYQGDQFSQQRTSSYTHMITSEKLAQKVVDELGLPMSAAELSAKVSATIVPRTVLLDVSVTDSSAQRAADIANTLADQFIAFAVPLETPVGQKEPRATITIVNDAEPATQPSAPKIATNMFYGLLGGLTLGALAIALVSALSQRVRTTDELARITGVPTLGPVKVPPHDREGQTSQLLVRGGDEAEGFRRLRVQFEAREPVPQSLLLASPSSSDAAARFAVDAAVAFAEAGRQTSLVVTHEQFEWVVAELGANVDDSGLADLLGGTASLRDVVQDTQIADLSVVTPGHFHDMESLLVSPAMSDVIDSLTKFFDRTVVLVPGVNDSSAAAVLSAITDAELLVVNMDTDTKPQIRRAVNTFNMSRVQLMGAVLTHS